MVTAFISTTVSTVCEILLYNCTERSAYNEGVLAVFLTYLPTPLTLLTDSKGAQSVHIAPEAFTVASQEFADNIEAWQNALPGKLKGKLESVGVLQRNAVIPGLT